MYPVLKHIVARTYKPLLKKYLSKTRVYYHGDIRLLVPPQVFHPGFFFSTRLLLQYVLASPLTGKTFLELGAGSGLISICTAKRGATVMATDINPVAVEYLARNCRQNNTAIEIICSDLFQNIPLQHFDMIVINPPYYKKKPVSLIDYAWLCGEKGEYFSGLFSQLPGYMHAGSEVVMILCDGCDIQMIEEIAARHHFRLVCLQIKQNLLEKNFIYKIEMN